MSKIIKPDEVVAYGAAFQGTILKAGGSGGGRRGHQCSPRVIEVGEGFVVVGLRDSQSAAD